MIYLDAYKQIIADMKEMNGMYENPSTFREGRHRMLALEIKMLACFLDVQYKVKHNELRKEKENTQANE